jgi:hypothetical protein
VNQDEGFSTNSGLTSAPQPLSPTKLANSTSRSAPGGHTSRSQTTGISTDAKQHPPTETMNRASGDVAASSQDTQRQMHAQPSVAEQPKGEGQPQTRAVEQRNDESAVVIASRHARAIPR